MGQDPVTEFEKLLVGLSCEIFRREHDWAFQFSKVEVWNEGYEDLGHGYVLEYFRFHVDWRAGGNGGTVTGGGIRLWRRGVDGGLKMLREIGTHDYRN